MSLKTKVKYPVAVRWKIPEARLQELRNSFKLCLTSAYCVIPGTDIEYYLSMNPNGEDEESRGHALIYLHLEFGGKKSIKAEYTFVIESANFCKNASEIYEETFGWGRLLCKTEELFDPKNGFIVGGKMIIYLDGFLMIEQDVPVKLIQLSGDGDSFCVTLWNQETKDFTIVADGKEITAHKIILSARSPVFAAMFQPHTKEAQENRVTIPDFSFVVVEAAIKLCYHSSLVNNISLEDMISVLQFFDKYDIETLKDNLQKYLIGEVNETNVCSLVNCSILSNAPLLRLKSSEFLEKCLRARKPVLDLDTLDKDFASNLLKNAFYPVV